VCKQSKVFFCFVLRLNQNQAGTASRFPSQKLILYAICFVKKSRIIICARVGGIIEKKINHNFFLLLSIVCRKNAVINHNNFCRAERDMRKILVASFLGLLKVRTFFPYT